MRKKEIGGYFELENFTGEDYYSDLYHLNLGRTALLALMEMLNCRKIILPLFLCDSVISACEKAGYDIRFYHVKEDFSPAEDVSPEADEYLYIVNYYGQLTDDNIIKYKEKYGNIIIDNTHAYFQRPVKDIPTIYSCRKFFGLPDGALLSCSGEMTELEKDVSAGRLKHILGRYEGTASEHYSEMLETAESYHNAKIMEMSDLTKNLLRGIDYKKTKEKRNENFLVLKNALNMYEKKQFSTPDGPFCFPFYSENAAQIRKQLAEKKIYVPTYWSNVINSMPENSVEFDLASNILALPCDQRYDVEDMITVSQELISLL